MDTIFTDFIDPDTKPSLVGVYEVDAWPDGRAFARWNGESWGLPFRFIDGAAGALHVSTGRQNYRWRGLAQNFDERRPGLAEEIIRQHDAHPSWSNQKVITTAKGIVMSPEGAETVSLAKPRTRKFMTKVTKAPLATQGTVHALTAWPLVAPKAPPPDDEL